MKKVTIFTHGSSKEDPGSAMIEVRLVDEKGKVIQELSESIGNAANDYAEYFAVVRGLQVTADLFGDGTQEMKFEVKLGSEVVKKQLNVELQINDVSLVGHFIEIHNLKVTNFPNLKFKYINNVSDKKKS